MKKFILNLFIISALLFVVLNWMPSFFINPLYGNKPFATKHAYFLENQDQYNTLVMGSSRMYRHLDSVLLDEHLAACDTSTFNLAAPATYNPEVYHLYENVLEDIDTGQFDFVFMELQPLVDIEPKNIKTDQSYYWMNLNDLAYASSYGLAANYPPKKKAGIIVDYSLSYIYRVIFNSRVLFSSEQDIGDERFIGSEGYFSLNQQMEQITGNDSLQKRFDSFHADPFELYDRLNYTTEQVALSDHSAHLNQTHLARLNDLIEVSADKGIHLVFILPPRLHQQYEELFALQEILPSEHLIAVVDPAKYPEMYALEYSFDAGHLTDEGASIFTDYAADQLLDICTNHK
ncbi:MAG: hypothetical protein AB8G95_08800 [Anaerolineae bacterium]